MIIEISAAESKTIWTSLRNPKNYMNISFNFKLHLRFSYKDIPKSVEEALQKLLKQAVEEGIIPEFKYVTRDILDAKIAETKEALQQCKNSSEREEIEKILKADYRYQALPYTIFLYNKTNARAIAKLCVEIDTLLEKIPLGDDASLCQSDVILTPFLTHVTCRQCVIKESENKEISIEAFDPLAKKLKENCVKTQFFSLLTQAVQDLKAPSLDKRASFMLIKPITEAGDENAFSHTEEKKNEPK